MADPDQHGAKGPLLAAAMIGAGALVGWRMALAFGAGDNAAVIAGLVVLMLLIASGAVLVPRWLGSLDSPMARKEAD